jgi:prephenate dehydratase
VLLVLDVLGQDRQGTVHSHVHALGQCRKIIRRLGLKAVVAPDTAGAARQGTTGSRESTTKRVVLCSSSSTFSARIDRP